MGVRHLVLKTDDEAPAAPVERHLPIRHEGPTMARNALCPKGTGKKFKYCCGADGKTKVRVWQGVGFLLD